MALDLTHFILTYNLQLPSSTSTISFQKPIQNAIHDRKCSWQQRSSHPFSCAKTIRHQSDLLIPGRGEPIKHGAVILHERKIDWVGTQSSIPAKYKALEFTHVPVLMPGLWDCHVHYFGASAKGGYAGIIGSAAEAGARISKDLERTLLAGFTSVREVGGYAGEISPVVEEGTILGPNIYSSISPISMTAGHGDSECSGSRIMFIWPLS
jgi:imidazolonepropionase-like amidohydrolase